jgi:hypothetical protein
MKAKGYSKLVFMDSQGTAMEIDKDVSLNSMSAAVRQGIQQATGKGTILTVESITKYGTLVAYDATVIRAGKESEIQVSPDGKLLDHRE